MQALQKEKVCESLPKKLTNWQIVYVIIYVLTPICSLCEGMIIDHQPNTRDLHTVPNTTIPYCGGGMTIHKGSDPGIYCILCT